MMTILMYVLKVILSTFLQIIILLGPLLILAVLMNLVSKQTKKYSFLLFGTKTYLYIFGWLGVSIHELGHALFCILFKHKIEKMVLFQPNGTGGALGYVNHSYNKNSIYQNIGNLFIGIGPILLGSILLYVITYYLYGFKIEMEAIDFKKIIVFDLYAVKLFANTAMQQLNAFLFNVFYGNTSTWWKSLIFIYCLYAIGSSITLSKPDVYGASLGFIFFLIILFLFNLITLWIGAFTLSFFLILSKYLTGLYFLIFISIFVNLSFLIILYLANTIKSFINR